MKRKSLFTILVLCLIFQTCIQFGFGQTIVYRDYFKGDIFWSGFQVTNAPVEKSLFLPLNNGAELRKLLCFVTIHKNTTDSAKFELNGKKYYLNKSKEISAMPFNLNPNSGPTRLYMLDITNDFKMDMNDTIRVKTFINSGTSDPYSWTMGIQFALLSNNELSNDIVFDVYGINSACPIVSDYQFKSMNPSVGSDLLFSHNGFVPSYNNLGCYLILESDTVGLLYGSDPQISELEYGGVIGSFKRENQVFIGIDGDQFNQQVNGNDGIIKINSNNVFDIGNFMVSYYSPTTTIGNHHIPNAFVLAYESSCETFEANFPKDTTICNGDLFQWSAGGGMKYEWSPKEGLSCYDCPNPIVTTHESTGWSLEIWNNDSCSRVQHLALEIRDPKWGAIFTNSEVCGENDGSINILQPTNDSKIYQYSLNGAATSAPSNTGKTFENLASGFYDIKLLDGPYCSLDTTVFIDQTQKVKASFINNSPEGLAPHKAFFKSTSEMATDLVWFIDGNVQIPPFESFTFQESGTYEILLIAQRFDPSCADTARHFVTVYDQLLLDIPNVFTPNGDGINESFTVTSNQTGLLQYTLHNRWGDVLKSDSIQLKANTPISIWDGANASEGTYFYQMRFETILHDPITSSGFFDIRK